MFLCAAAAYGLLKKKLRLFSLNGNNAFLEFFIEGVPDIVERHLDSKKVSRAHTQHVPRYSLYREDHYNYNVSILMGMLSLC